MLRVCNTHCESQSYKSNFLGKLIVRTLESCLVGGHICIFISSIY